MAYAHVDLALGTGLNDGTDWTDAYQAGAGLVTAAAAAAAGDTIWIKNSSTPSTVSITTSRTLAYYLNPVKVIAVKSATTNTSGSVVQSDLIPGKRTGQATAAYAYGTETPPTITPTGTNDITIAGCINIYGMIFVSNDNLTIMGALNGIHNVILEECKATVSGNGDILAIGCSHDDRGTSDLNAYYCLIDSNLGRIRFQGASKMGFFKCILTSNPSASAFYYSNFTGQINLHGCDLSLSDTDTGMFAVNEMQCDSVTNLWNCDLPASHVLTSGTGAHNYFIANYGSNDDAALTSSDSVQELEIITHLGTINNSTEERTSGGTDGATGGWSYAVVPNNVTDNVVAIITPWRWKWIEGDGTSQTLTVFVANNAAADAANDLEDDEIYLEILYPSEAGDSMYDYLPDEGAPTGFGKMQLLGTAADITDDTGSTWTAANNHQKLTATIAPDYQGPLRWRIHYSKSSGPTLYVDPFPVIA